MKPKWIQAAQERLRWRLADARAFRERLQGGAGREFDIANGRVLWRRLCFSHDERLGWRFVPSLRARIYQAGRYHTVKTNPLGFRSEDDFVAIRGSRLRLIILGDSYAAGDGVDNCERFSDLLSRLLPDVEVLNFAMPGTGIDQQVLTYEHVASQFNADACLFCMADMDIFRLTVKAWPALEWGTRKLRYRAKPYFALENGRLRLCHETVPRGMRDENEMGDWGPVGFMKEKTAADWVNAYALNSEPCRLMKAIMGRFFIKAGTMPVFLIPLPSPVHGMGRYPATYRDTFAALASEAPRASFVDLLPAFEKISLKERRQCYFDQDPHYSARGHQVVAEAMALAISARLAEIRVRGAV